MHRVFVPLVALALLAPLLACRGAPEPTPEPAPAPPRARGVVLISIDALRADGFGLYGNPRATSPFVDRLGERAVVFDHAYAQVPSTLPSHMSMFTGLYPSEHDVFPPSNVLAAEIRTLPEVLQAAGVRTFGHTEGGYVQGGYGFARGFEEWTDTPYADDTDVEATFRRGLDSLGRVGAGEPFFLFLHTYSIHDPYDPPARYRELFWPGPPPADAFEPLGPHFAEFNARKRDASPAAIAYYRALYDAGVRYLDDVLAGFFAELERLGIAEETAVILTSDHGEEFGEHDNLVHTQAYRECLHIPLIVALPGVAGGRAGRLVQTIDFAPTIYDLLGVPGPEGMTGASLGADLARPERSLSGHAYAQNEMNGFVERTLLQAVGEQLFQIYRSQAVTEGDGFWVSRRVRFDARPPATQLRAVSFHAPRRVEVRIDGEPAAPLLVGTDWASHRIEIPARQGKSRLELATEECTVPGEVGRGPDPRCLSFKVHGPSIERLELFDLTQDPGAQEDLSFERSDLVRTLGLALKRYPEVPRASATGRTLSDEQVRHLKALGYL